MASGKSLELAKIKPPKPSKVCICGAPWNDHLRKDGRGVLAKYSGREGMGMCFSTSGAESRLTR